MRFLADESCDATLVRILIAAGHDVRFVAYIEQGADDAVVLALACDEKRILLTEDRDFGRHVFLEGVGQVGVVYLRYRFAQRQEVATQLVRLVERRGEALQRSFAVVQPDRVRLRKMP